MLNIEDFKEEMIKKDGGPFGIETVTHKVLECVGYDCGRCLFHGDCKRKRWDWLLAEKKDVIVLTKFEHSILEWLYNECYEYIIRNEIGHLFASSEKPTKQQYVWTYRERNHELSIFDKLFKFVKCKDAEPTSIKDVLDNCEVLEND